MSNPDLKQIFDTLMQMRDELKDKPDGWAEIYAEALTIGLMTIGFHRQCLRDLRSVHNDLILLIDRLDRDDAAIVKRALIKVDKYLRATRGNEKA